MVPRGVTQHVPDMYEIREGVKEGVRSMAGKMSSIVGSITDAIEVCKLLSRCFLFGGFLQCLRQFSVLKQAGNSYF